MKSSLLGACLQEIQPWAGQILYALKKKKEIVIDGTTRQCLDFRESKPFGMIFNKNSCLQTGA